MYIDREARRGVYRGSSMDVDLEKAVATISGFLAILNQLYVWYTYKKKSQFSWHSN
jgi:hypothetical protein